MTYTVRANQSEIFQLFDSTFITAILGPRRVGKSTLVEHYIAEHPERKWVCLNMDQRALRQRVTNDALQAIIEESALQKIGHGDKIWVVIDEAQKCPESFEQIKMIYDTFIHQDAIKFILTGSGYLELHDLSAETLAGRVQLQRLRELSIRELVQLQNPSVNIPTDSLFDIIVNDASEEALTALIDSLKPFKKILTDALESQLIWGGLPEIYLNESVNEKSRYISDYLQTYLEKDVRAIEEITDLTLYQNMMRVIAEQTGMVRDEKRQIDAIGCTRKTLKKYRGYLAATMLYKEIYPYIGSSLKRLVKSPKCYLTNNGLISYLTNISHLETLLTTGKVGHRFENWFFKELQVWLDKDCSFSNCYYWRTAAGAEVDFILDRKPQIYPFEVTKTATLDGRKLRHLKNFMADEPDVKYGYLIYQGDFVYDKEARLFMIPAWVVA